MSVSDLLMLDQNSKHNVTFRLLKVLQEKVRKENVQLITSLNVDHCCLHFLRKPMPLLPPVVDRSSQSGQHISPYQTKSGLQKIPPITSLLLSSTTCCNMYSSCSMSCQVCQCVSFCGNLHSKMDVRVSDFLVGL